MTIEHNFDDLQKKVASLTKHPPRIMADYLQLPHPRLAIEPEISAVLFTRLGLYLADIGVRIIFKPLKPGVFAICDLRKKIIYISVSVPEWVGANNFYSALHEAGHILGNTTSEAIAEGTACLSALAAGCHRSECINHSAFYIWLHYGDSSSKTLKRHRRRIIDYVTSISAVLPREGR